MIFTIGYSDLNFNEFEQILIYNNISIIIDVRSIPYSKKNREFDRDNLINNKNFDYLFLGDLLGGKKYSRYKKLDVNDLVKEDDFLKGMNILSNFINKYLDKNITILCLEKEPIICHRFLIISNYLEYVLKIKVNHLIGNIIYTNEKFISDLQSKYNNQKKNEVINKQLEYVYLSKKY